MTIYTKEFWKQTAWLVLVLQVLALLGPVVGPAALLAQPASDVERAQTAYEQSRFDEAITLLRDLVDRGALSGPDLIKAREILARSYVKKGYPVQARDMFKEILKQDPTWRPDPIRVPPDETAVFEQALREYELEQPGETPAPVTPEPTEPEPQPTPPQTLPDAAQVVPPVKEEKKSSKWWLWALGAAAVGGVVAIVASGGGDGDGDGDTNQVPPPGPFPPPPAGAR